MYEAQQRKDKIRLFTGLLIGKILSVIFFSGCYYFYSHYHKLKTEIIDTKANIAKLNQDIITAEDKKNNWIPLQKLYLLDKEKKDIKNAIIFLTKLKELYKIENLDFKILNPVSIMADKSTETARVLVHFNSQEDGIAYKFMDAFINEFPKTVKIVNFSFSNINEPKNLTTSQITFDWSSPIN